MSPCHKAIYFRWPERRRRRHATGNCRSQRCISFPDIRVPDIRRGVNRIPAPRGHSPHQAASGCASRGAGRGARAAWIDRARMGCLDQLEEQSRLDQRGARKNGLRQATKHDPDIANAAKEGPGGSQAASRRWSSHFNRVDGSRPGSFQGCSQLCGDCGRATIEPVERDGATRIS